MPGFAKRCGCPLMKAPPVSVCPYASTRFTPQLCQSAAVSCGRGAAPELARIRQDGWDILLEGWSPEGLPTRLSAQRGEVSLRLVVDGRTGGTP